MARQGGLAWARTAARLLAWGLPLLWLADALHRDANCDVALLLEAARRWLAGEHLYIEVIDVNPPLIIWLSAMPVLLDGWSGILDATTWWTLGVVAAVIGTAGVVRRMTHEHGDAAGLTAFWALATLPGFDFGQREHLVACAVLVWVAAAARRCAGHEPGSCGAITVALGFCLKPNFLVAPLLVEAAVLLRRGLSPSLRDPWPIALVLVPGVYAAAILVFAPGFLSVALPLVIELYLPLGAGVTGVLAAPWVMALAAVGAALVATAVLWSRSPLAQLAAVALAGALVAAVSQGKGWSYHLLPPTVLACWTAFLLAAEWVRRPAASQALRTVRGAAAGAAVAATVACAPGPLDWPFRPPPAPLEARLDRVAGLFGAHAEDDDVLVLSMEVWPFYPAMTRARAQMAMRFFTLWPIAGAYRRCPDGPPVPQLTWRPIGAMPPSERFAFEGIVRDFADHWPALVVVQTDWRPDGCAQRGFDLLGYFLRHPEFARVFAGYARLATLDGLAVFRRWPIAVPPAQAAPSRH